LVAAPQPPPEPKGPAGPILCDAGRFRPPDLATVDALARLALAARRSGRELRLVNASPELRGLLGLVGLGGVLPCPASAFESGRQAEEREEPGRVEEECDPADGAP
jgi:hypothetical protein